MTNVSFDYDKKKVVDAAGVYRDVPLVLITLEALRNSSLKSVNYPGTLKARGYHSRIALNRRRPEQRLSCVDRMARVNRFGFLAIAMVFHLVYMYSIFDIYFVSPIVTGMREYGVRRPAGVDAPAKRLMLFVGKFA